MAVVCSDFFFINRQEKQKTLGSHELGDVSLPTSLFCFFIFFVGREIEYEWKYYE